MFSVEFSIKALKDLKKLKDKKEATLLALQSNRILTANPWPEGKIKKKIQGKKTSFYRLRMDTKKDSYRLFYVITEKAVIIFRVVSKKEADRVITNL